MILKKILPIVIIIIFISSPNFIFADDYIEEDLSYLEELEQETSSDLPNSISINARHAVVFDRNSKTVLLGKSENEICKMASTTKIMTAIIVLENCSNLNETVVISKKAARNWWFKTWFVHK